MTHNMSKLSGVAVAIYFNGVSVYYVQRTESCNINILVLTNILLLTNTLTLLQKNILFLILIWILVDMKRRWEALRIAYRGRISVLLLCVQPPTERHKQEGPVLGRFAEHMRMP